MYDSENPLQAEKKVAASKSPAKEGAAEGVRAASRCGSAELARASDAATPEPRQAQSMPLTKVL